MREPINFAKMRGKQYRFITRLDIIPISGRPDWSLDFILMDQDIYKIVFPSCTI